MYEVYDRKKEIREAILAGEIALDHLKEAKDHLDSASTWGMFDLFDGLFADLFVQSKISDYRKQVETAMDRVQDILFVLNNQLSKA